MPRRITSARAATRTSLRRRAWSDGRDDGPHVLTLYIAGLDERSQRAIVNVRRICDERLTGRYVLDIVDVYQHPDIARREGIVALPTLVCSRPGPARILVGDMSNLDRVLLGLGLRGNI